jgi:hypothetical protein
MALARKTVLASAALALAACAGAVGEGVGWAPPSSPAAGATGEEPMRAGSAMGAQGIASGTATGGASAGHTTVRE